MLAGDRLWEQVCRILDRAEGDEQIRWRRRTGRKTVEKRILGLDQGEDEPRIQIWIRVRLGGQRMTQVAQAYGYRDGSGVHQVVRRLEARAWNDRLLRQHLRRVTICKV